MALETRSDQTDICVEQESSKKTAKKAVFFEVTLGRRAVALQSAEVLLFAEVILSAEVP